MVRRRQGNISCKEVLWYNGLPDKVIFSCRRCYGIMVDGGEIIAHKSHVENN